MVRYGIVSALLLTMWLGAEAAGQTLSGTVKGPKGEAVEGAEIILIPGSYREPALTDAAGRFELTWEPGPAQFTEGVFYLMARQPDKNLAGVESFGEETLEIAVTLREGATAKGRVVGPDGKPIENALAMLIFLIERVGTSFGTSFGKDARTDPDGFYEFECLPVDQRFHVLVSQAEGYGSGRGNFIAETPGTLEIEKVVLPVANMRVTGQVVDAEGNGVANVRIQTHGEGQPNLSLNTDEEGRFVLDPVCAGQIMIIAIRQNSGAFQQGTLQTEGGARDVKVILGEQNMEGQFMPRRPASLKGKGLGEALAAGGVTLPAEPNSVALFVWDMNQRPSRHFAQAFAEKSALLKEKGLTAVLLQAGATGRPALDAWLKENGIDCPCGMIEGDVEEAKFKLGVRGLPWLILTDGEGKVVAEGVSVDELETVLNREQ